MTTEERLERLEKELAGARRRNRVMLAAAVMTASGMFLLGAGGERVQKVVRAEKYELVDSTGNARAWLAMFEGVPMLLLNGQNGQSRASLSVTEAGPALRFDDRNGKARVALCLLDSGRPTLALADRNESIRATLGVADDGSPALSLFSQNDKLRAVMATKANGNPGLALFDQDGEQRAVVGCMQMVSLDGKSTLAYPESSLLLLGPDGKQVWHAP